MLKWFKNYYFLLILSLFTVGYAYVDVGVRYDFWVLTVFFSIGLLSLFGLFLSIDKHSVSLNKTFCLFYYFFFALAPIIQFKNNSVFFVSRNISDASYIKYGFVLGAILSGYLVLYHITYSTLDKKMDAESSATPQKKAFAFLPRLYLLSGLAILFYLYLLKFNWAILIFRPFVFKLKENTNLGLVGYAILLIVQLIPFVCFMYYKLRQPKNNVHPYLLLTMMLVVCFPSSMSRGVLAMIYIPVLLVFFPFLHNKTNYLKMYLIGLLVVFPMLNNLRYLYEGKIDFKYDMFDTAHFSSFQNFTFLLEEKLITNGRQLLGSIFFFVQESHWENKPWGTGTLLAEKTGYSYTNIEMPFFGEGYANFGYLGIVVFLVVITFFNAFLDHLYVKNKMASLLKTVYYIFLGLEFYILRGDLFSSVKIITSFAFAIIMVECGVRFFNKRNILE